MGRFKESMDSREVSKSSRDDQKSLWCRGAVPRGLLWSLILEDGRFK